MSLEHQRSDDEDGDEAFDLKVNNDLDEGDCKDFDLDDKNCEETDNDDVDALVHAVHGEP